MENAVEALMLAFAVILLVLALSLTMYIFSQARQTSDLMLHLTDPTEYYEYFESNGIKVDNKGNRIVGIETIIPTLYRYSKEDIKIVFKEGKMQLDAKGNVIDVQIGDPIEIYETQTDPNHWTSSYKNDFDNSGTSKSICSFDLQEEQARREPWTGSLEEIKKNLDAIILGGDYNGYTYGFGIGTRKKGLLEYFNQASFVEMIGEIVEVKSEDDENSGIKGNKTTTKKVITYVFIGDMLIDVPQEENTIKVENTVEVEKTIEENITENEPISENTTRNYIEIENSVENLILENRINDIIDLPIRNGEVIELPIEKPKLETE